VRLYITRRIETHLSIKLASTYKNNFFNFLLNVEIFIRILKE